MLSVTFTHEDWGVFGNATLSGKYVEAMLANPDADRSILEIVIEETSMGYRRQNNGPEEIIVPEFMPSCLIKDILSLTQKQGVEIRLVIKEIHEVKR